MFGGVYTNNPEFKSRVERLQLSNEYQSYIIAKVEVPNTNYKYTNDVMNEITDKLVTVKKEAENEIKTAEVSPVNGGSKTKKRRTYINRRITRRSIISPL